MGTASRHIIFPNTYRLNKSLMGANRQGLLLLLPFFRVNTDRLLGFAFSRGDFGDPVVDVTSRKRQDLTGLYVERGS